MALRLALVCRHPLERGLGYRCTISILHKRPQLMLSSSTRLTLMLSYPSALVCLCRHNLEDPTIRNGCHSYFGCDCQTGHWRIWLTLNRYVQVTVYWWVSCSTRKQDVIGASERDVYTLSAERLGTKEICEYHLAIASSSTISGIFKTHPLAQAFNRSCLR